MKTINAWIYKTLMKYMEDDPYFCMCGCSSTKHNIKRLLIKIYKQCTKK